MPTCKISGQTFEISDLEKALRDKFQAPLPDKLPQYTFQELSAFWHHFALYKRKCDGTGEEIISVFDTDCPYPVWNRDYWIKNANPPQAEVDFQKPFFDQLWQLFQTCPIPHNLNVGNQNSEYADDWWYSKDCYLCHSGLKCENLRYCYRVVNLKDCQYCVFCFDSELCFDLAYSNNCYNVVYGLYSRNCRDSAFLFDCANCSDCLFCWNLRNKQYCIANKQYTKEEYQQEKAKFSFASQKNYELTKQKFKTVLQTQAWWKANRIEMCQNVTGDYLESNKNVMNCFLIEKFEDCANVLRAYEGRDCLDSVTVLSSELVYYSALVQDHCYDARFCYNVVNSKFVEYSAHCFNVEHCFGCCGLVGKKYCIFNKQYTPEEYEKTVAQIKRKMAEEGVANTFFPKHFAAHPYDDSLAGFYWPLLMDEQKKQGWRVKNNVERKNEGCKDVHEIPDNSLEVSEAITQEIFWDDTARKPFQITKQDIAFSRRLSVPLPNSYYIRRIKENFSWIFFNGQLRETTCALTGKKISTSIPAQFDGRILSEEAYLKQVY